MVAIEFSMMDQISSIVLVWLTLAYHPRKHLIKFWLKNSSGLKWMHMMPRRIVRKSRNVRFFWWLAKKILSRLNYSLERTIILVLRMKTSQFSRKEWFHKLIWMAKSFLEQHMRFKCNQLDQVLFLSPSATMRRSRRH